MGVEDFLAGYDPRRHAPVAVTVDVVALTIRDRRLHVLIVERGAEPYAGSWALPGGFIRPDEDLAEAAVRELAEETGVAARPAHLEQLAGYGGPGRDPRMRVVSIAHLAFAPGLPGPEPGTDAAAAVWHPVDDVPPLAFDHARILADGVERARSKLEYTPLATAFAGELFTISELRLIYESVWGTPLHAGNFHRKVLSVPGFVESTGQTTETGGPKGGPRAKLYRAGDARLLHPALLRPAREDDLR
ncbi:Bifunctional NMN adenylyltransferase/Nudix hydrolase [Nonomuraea coxensis DSM 45129]|uniref:Bifunctional NMN adenylyltransferase/Nudix hydrolase n=1 Tax=Nonomuraea coxensis DSM 45129 TaxID=1122611 RepID=A0ABX8UC96_9ACTN|nr:NUDIX hydrolase [Nonomuraea coxensis]QYC45411.1 Bifunctional NMN adenylyltransferase/Nudix hydrolase [Nonomuraea coxensis DSM 45129]